MTYSSYLRALLLAGVGLLIAMGLPGAFQSPDDPPPPSRRLSVSIAGVEGNDESRDPSVSFDGRLVAFSSKATNLVSGDTNGEEDIFIVDRNTGAIERLTAGNDDSRAPSLSATGRYVAFHSKASDLVPDDTNNKDDVFVLDRETGETERVSVSSTGEQGDDRSHEPAISGDGRYVAFRSYAENFSEDDGDRADIFVFDRETRELTLVSRGLNGPPDEASHAPAISADGRTIAFHSKATNLITGDTNGQEDVFVSDWQNGALERASIGTGGQEGERQSRHAALSADGAIVAFESYAENFSTEDGVKKDIFVRDRNANTTTLVSSGVEVIDAASDRPAVSADGRFVTFRSPSPDDGTGGRGDRKTKSKNPKGKSKKPKGKSKKSKGKSKKRKDIYIRDLQSQQTRRVSLGDGDSSRPGISGNGAVIAYESKARDLVEGDTNNKKDVFAVEVVVVNQPPSATDDEAATPEDTPILIDARANDTDPDGDVLVTASVSAATNGTTSLTADGNVLYTPFPDYHGPDGFTYVTEDGRGGTGSANVLVTVTPVNDPPIATDDVAQTIQPNAVVIDVLENDTDIDGDTLSVSEATADSGTVTVLEDNTLSYAPAAGFLGVDIVTYAASDAAASDSANVRVTVEPAPPEPVDDTASTFTDDSVVIDVLANDIGEGLRLLSVTDPANGTTEMSAGSVTYIPNVAFIGTDTFQYTLIDTNDFIAGATVTVDVVPRPNTEPIAIDDRTSTFEKLAVTIDVLKNDRDPDLDVLRVDTVTPARAGTVELQADNRLTYTPNADFAGRDTFKYMASDDKGGEAEANVTVTVLGDEVPPTIRATLSLEPMNGWHAADVTITFDCADGESGLATCSEPVVVTNEGAAQTFTGTATDQAGNSAQTTVTINLDKTAPAIGNLTGPDTARNGQVVTVDANVDDALGIGAVRFRRDGVDVAEALSPPYTYRFTFEGTTPIAIEATAIDLAGNEATSSPLTIANLGGGFVQGEVYDDHKGTPLPGATVQVGSESVTTDLVGRFHIETDLATTHVHIDKGGYTSVERHVEVNALRGTVILDARLTPIDGAPTTIDSAGGVLSSGDVTLTIPSGAVPSAALRLVPLSPHGLEAPLPLGWSPASAVLIEPTSTSFAVPSALTTTTTTTLDARGAEIALARYDTTSHGWMVVSPDAIDTGGTYAFVIADAGDTAPPIAVPDNFLEGVDPVETSFGLNATSDVQPKSAPFVPNQTTATGRVVVSSLITLPSGTVFSARVEESFRSVTEGELFSAPYAQEIGLYRYPRRDDGALHTELPVTPSRALPIDEVIDGALHVELRPAPDFVRGRLVGSEGIVVNGEGGAKLVLPPGALADTVPVSVQALEPTDIALAPAGLTLHGAAEVDLANATTQLPAELSVPTATAAPGAELYAAKILFVAGHRKLRLTGPAALAQGRLTTNSVDTSGTYLFVETEVPVAIIEGTIREGGTPAGLAVVESSTTAFMDVTPPNGAYRVAAALTETALTARSLQTGNVGSLTLTPPTTETITADIDLTATGPFVTSTAPGDGEAGVALDLAIQISFSEPVLLRADATLEDAVILRDPSAVAIPRRITFGAGNRSISILPDARLQPLTAYTIELTPDLTDASDNALVPFSATFTTLDEIVAGFNPDAIVVTTPDADTRVVQVTAPTGSFEPGADVTIINNTAGIVVSGNVASDGSLFFEIRAEITDELQIRILDGSGREVVIDKTEYQAPDGSVAIGTKGGTITVGDFSLVVPDGALDEASVFTLTPVEQERIDALAPAVGAGGFGAGVEVGMGGAVLNVEADLAFPIPPDAPSDAHFIVAIPTDLSVNGETVTYYEVVDTASVQGDKIITDSFPFLGPLLEALYISIWYPPAPEPEKSSVGVIAGVTQETDGKATGRTTRPVPGVLVRITDATRGNYSARSDENGVFALIHEIASVSSPVIRLEAVDERTGRVETAVIVEEPLLVEQFRNVREFASTSRANFNFDLIAETPGSPQTTITLLHNVAGEDDPQELQSDFAGVGEELLIRVTFDDLPGRVNLTVNDVPIELREIDGLTFEARFTPSESRGYNVKVEAIDAFLNLFGARKTFLAVAAGTGLDIPKQGPPGVITDGTIPSSGETDVSVTQILSLGFTEPVTNVSASAVVLREAGATALVPIELIGSGPDGVGVVKREDRITALTIRPVQELEFGARYELELNGDGDIVDFDVPSPNGLEPAPTVIDFTTFAPTPLSSATPGFARGIVSLRDRVYVALPDNTGLQGTLATFDASNPTTLKRLVGTGSPAESQFFGSMVSAMDGVTDVNLGAGPSDYVAVLSLNPLIGTAGITAFDVKAATPPYAYVGFVTTTVPGRGWAADLDLHEGFAYVASGDAGVQVIDLALAASIYRATEPTSPFSISSSAGRGLVSRGIGFGQGAIINTIDLKTESGEPLRANAVAVARTDNHGLVGYVTAFDLASSFAYFSTLDVNAVRAEPIHATIQLEKDGLSMSATRVGATRVGSRMLAVVVGRFSNEGRLAVIDVTDPAAPVILVLTALEGTAGRSLTFSADGQSVFITTPQAIETYSLKDPSAPKLTTKIPGGAAEVALAGPILASHDGETVKLTALDIIPTLGILPTPIVTDEALRTAQPGRFTLGVIPKSVGVGTARVEILSGDQFVTSLPGSIFEGSGETPFELGFPLPPNPHMRLVLDGDTSRQHVSLLAPIPTIPLLSDVSPRISMLLTVDPINGTSCASGASPILYRLGAKARIRITYVIGATEKLVRDEVQDPTTVAEGLFTHEVTEFGLFPAATANYPFRIVAELEEDPSVRVEASGTIQVEANGHNVLPVGQTFVKGVSLSDGHLVVSQTDLRIPGRIPLEVTRTYSSAGHIPSGMVGANWNFNYASKLIRSSCVTRVVGGDGSGQTFTPTAAGGFRPQKGYHTELRRNADESFDFFTKGRIRYHYFLDPQKFDVKLFAERIPLEFIEDPNGNKLRMVYDNDGRLIEVVEEDSSGARGRSLYFDYVEVFAEWRLSKVRGPLGLVVDYLYDETTANLVEVRRDERIERYVYQGPEHFDRHNMTVRIGPNGVRTEYEYFEGDDPFPNEQAGAGLLPALKVEYVKAVKELSRAVVTTFSYDLSELQDRRLTTTVTDARGNETTYLLNGNGSPLRRIDEPGAVVTEMEWAVDDIFKLREVDANGRVTRFEYDDNANLTKEIIETGSLGDVVTEFAYDPVFNKMTKKLDAEDRATSFEIDATTGNLTSTTDAEGNVTTFTYDASNGDLVSTRGPRPSQATTFTYDAFGNPETATDALGNTTITDYDERSRLLSSTDTFGRSMVQSFDGLDRVTRVERTDALGSSDPGVVLREYHAGGQVHRQTNGLGVITTIVLDGMNRVIETNATVNGETLTTAAVYDGNSNVLSSTDRRGVATLNTYDALNRLTELEVGGQTVATMEYDALGNKLAETDLQGNRTAFAYDDLYRVSARTLPTGHVEGFTYDRVGNKLAENDANGHVTTFQYDRLNRLVRRLDAEGNEVTFAYDEAGNAVQEKDITRGLETKMAYDALNRPIVRTVSGSSFSYTTSFDYRDSRHEVVETDGRGFQRTTELDGFDRVHRVVLQTGEAELVTTNFYDANGNLSSTKDPEGRETVFVYDGLNRLLEIQHPLSLTTRFLYDGEGNKTEETKRRGVPTRFTYDHLSRLTESATDPQITGNPVTTTIQYDDAARTRTEFDARGNATAFVMDGQGRVVTITDADNNAQSFEYDGVNKLAEVDKRGQRTSFEYDGINRLVTVTDALSQKIETAYRDAALQVVETDKRGLVRRTQLDALGRLVSVTRSNVTLEQHAYDPNNNRILSTDANGNQTQFTYDGANRLTARTDGFGSADATTTRFTYDGVGNLLEEKDGRATGKAFDIHNTYDALNRLTSVQDGAGQVTSFEYDGEGNRTAQTEPKGNRTEFSYGELSELTEVRMPDSGLYRYTYDPNRNRTQQTDANGNVVAFTYDKLNRMERMEQQGAGPLVTLHTYDPNGNEITLTDPKGQVIDFNYDELNRLTNKTYQPDRGRLRALHTHPRDRIHLRPERQPGPNRRAQEHRYRRPRGRELVQDLRHPGPIDERNGRLRKNLGLCVRLSRKPHATGRPRRQADDLQLRRPQPITNAHLRRRHEHELRVLPGRPEKTRHEPQQHEFYVRVRRRRPNDGHRPPGPGGRGVVLLLRIRRKRQPQAPDRNERGENGRDHLRLRRSQPPGDGHVCIGNGGGHTGHVHVRPCREPAL